MLLYLRVVCLLCNSSLSCRTTVVVHLLLPTYVQYVVGRATLLYTTDWAEQTCNANKAMFIRQSVGPLSSLFCYYEYSIRANKLSTTLSPGVSPMGSCSLPPIVVVYDELSFAYPPSPCLGCLCTVLYTYPCVTHLVSLALSPSNAPLPPLTLQPLPIYSLSLPPF